MCAQFMIKAELAQLARLLKARLKDALLQPRDRIVPYTLAPVVVMEDGERVLKLMSFSLVPSWSKERKVKFATHNARLVSTDEKTGKDIPVYQKPTWRTPFAKRHCIVPMSGFVEPIYSGKLAGNMVEFRRPDSELLIAAGIWDLWENKKDGEVLESFAVLTDDPIPFVEKTGHDRSPVFLTDAAAEDWLNPKSDDPADWLKALRKGPGSLALETEIDRPLAKGWEKRR